MKSVAYLILSVFLFISTGCKDNVREEILKIEESRKDALANKDMAVIDQTMHFDYLFITPEGEIIDKKKEMAGFEKGSTSFDRFETDEQVIRVFGNTAIVTGRADIEGESGGNEVEGLFRYSRVYHKSDLGWQIVHSQFNKING